MRLLNPNILLLLTLVVEICGAIPLRLQSYKKTSNAPPTSSVVNNTPPPAVALPQPAAAAPAKGPPVLLSQATAEQAGGGVPTGPPPEASFSPNAIALFKVANFIEGIESGFFAEALQTLAKDPTFTNATADGRSIANVTSQIAAQELVHKATVEGLLGSVMEPAVPSCQTIFPVSNTSDFLAKANLVTSASIGVIISITQSIGGTDTALITPLASILSVESQQDTFFRMSGSNTPSASPFNTAISATFAYNIALPYVDPRSCPQLLPLPILPSLNLTSPVFAATAPLTPPTSITFTISEFPQPGTLFIGWVNQANPVSYTAVTVKDGVGMADVPKGLTGVAFAALTGQNAAITLDGLTNATLAGPAALFMS